MAEQEFLTVGQLARKVGTTVRTIQYYDQQGLLSPSAKGPGNQRLYSPADESTLYHILTLKYLGLSLADIKEQRDAVTDAASLRAVISRTMEALQADFESLMKRLAVLHSLLDATQDGDEVDWEALAHTIEGDSNEQGQFWQQVDDDVPAAEESDAMRERGAAIASWHELVADTIALMSEHVDPADPRTASIARRYQELGGLQKGTPGQGFIIPDHAASHHGSSEGSFDMLRDSVMRYLESARASHGAKDPQA